MSEPPPALRFSLFAPHKGTLRHGIFTRHGGVSTAPWASLNVSFSVRDDGAAVAENRRRCAAALDLAPAQLVTGGLVHGAAVATVRDDPADRLPDGSGIVPGVDALITDRPGVGLLVTAADCLQVLLFDPQRRAIGLAHAGWRGLAADALGETVRAMAEAFGSERDALLAGIGPGLGPCCARFSDPTTELPACFAPHIRGLYVDLPAIAAAQLRHAGLSADHIEAMHVCTVCNRDRFFSHRGDTGRTGRFAAIVALGG
jgi:purine-nucleoside/S-methyl-5'-thioadenosine phosphorylase / adenosine deaminase